MVRNMLRCTTVISFEPETGTTIIAEVTELCGDRGKNSSCRRTPTKADSAPCEDVVRKAQWPVKDKFVYKTERKWKRSTFC